MAESSFVLLLWSLVVPLLAVGCWVWRTRKRLLYWWPYVFMAVSVLGLLYRVIRN